MEKVLIHYNHNHDALGRFASSGGSGGGSIFKRKKTTTPKVDTSKMTPAEKAAETRRLKAEHDKAKKEAIASGDPEKIKPFTTELSDKELKDVTQRIKDIKSINDAASKAAIDRAQKKWDKLGTLNSNVDKIIDAYDKVAMINNTFNETKLPRVPKDADKKGNKGTTYLDKFYDSATETLKNSKSMNSDQLKEQNNRLKELESLKKKEKAEQAIKDREKIQKNIEKDVKKAEKELKKRRQ